MNVPRLAKRAIGAIKRRMAWPSATSKGNAPFLIGGVYGNSIPWEIAVQLCISDFLREGDCALDVGANIGALSIAMARIVGPSGHVHAFEANPRLVADLDLEFRHNGVAERITLVPKAVFRESSGPVSFYCDPSVYGGSSGLSNRGDGWAEATVDTVSIDDYCREQELHPDLIKVDVEEFEAPVLEGARAVLAEDRPIVLFEYTRRVASDPCLVLEPLEYRFFDVNLYEEVDRKFYEEEFPEVQVVNLLAIPNEKVAGSRYEKLTKTVIESRSVSDGELTVTGLSAPSAGRYVVVVEIAGNDEDRADVGVFDESGERINLYGAGLGELKRHPCSYLPFQLKSPARLDVRLNPTSGTSPALRSVKLVRIW